MPESPSGSAGTAREEIGHQIKSADLYAADAIEKSWLNFFATVVCCSSGKNIVISKYLLFMFNQFWQYKKPTILIITNWK